MFNKNIASLVVDLLQHPHATGIAVYLALFSFAPGQTKLLIDWITSLIWKPQSKRRDQTLIKTSNLPIIILMRLTIINTKFQKYLSFFHERLLLVPKQAANVSYLMMDNTFPSSHIQFIWKIKKKQSFVLLEWVRKEITWES